MKQVAAAYTAVALIAFNSLLLLLVLDMAARVVESVRPSSDNRSPLGYDYAPYRMMKHATAPWPLNADGFRERPLSPTGTDDRYRIVFLGGSVCIGFGQNTGEPLPRLLEQELLRRGLANVEVYNLCQGGTVSGQELAILIQYGLPLQPRMVVSFNGANDLLHPLPSGTDEAPNLPYMNRELAGMWRQSDAGLFQALVRSTAFGRVSARLAQKVFPRKPARESVPAEDVVRSFIEMMDLTSRLAAAYGAEHVVILQPIAYISKPLAPSEEAVIRSSQSEMALLATRARELWPKTASRLAAWAASGKARFYDLEDAFRDVREPLYLDSVHFSTDKAYPLLLSQLVSQGFLDQIEAGYKRWAAGRDGL